jgi:2-polyprenyl-6-methoxyphenol hydroxylase-like FAD-dependent oxidoreductase
MASDVIVAGAGPAGSFLAWLLGRRGKRVLLLDRARFPRVKACGEGIMPHAVRLLDREGALPLLLAAGARPFTGIRYVDQAGRAAAASFPGPAAVGISLPRDRLDALLLDLARAQPTVEVREGARVDELVVEGGRVTGITGTDARAKPFVERARLCVGADGIHSRFHRHPSFAVAFPRPYRFGLRIHVAGIERLEPVVEVHLFRGGEAYLTPQAGGTALASLLLDRRALGDVAFLRARGSVLRVLAALPGLAGRMERAEPLDALAFKAPLGSRVGRCVAPGAWLVGDAAGALDPITGEGIGVALRSADFAARAIASVLDGVSTGAAAAAAYSRERAALIRPLAKFTGWVLRAAERPARASRLLARLASSPELFADLLGVAAGLQPLSAIPLRRRIRLVL